MKVIVNGALGRMGQVLLKMISERKHGACLAAAIDKASVSEDIYQSLEEFGGDADVIIDFSNHAGTSELIDYAVTNNIPLVICTTGHTEEELADIEAASEVIPIFHSANMSLGVAALADLAKKAAAIFPNADIEIVEKHHNQKLDAPSGTALMIANKIKEERENATYVYGRGGHRKREQNEIGIHAIRLGNVIGEHEIMINTGNETITLKHEAHDRALFADGALFAAEFVLNMPNGLYCMDDVVKSEK